MKRTRFLRILASVLLVASFCVFLVPMTASAATTTPYYLTHGSWYQNNATDRETGVGCPKEFNMYMYGSTVNGSGTLYDNACLNWDYFNFYVDCNPDEMDYAIWFRLIKDGEDYVFDNVISYGNEDRTLYSGSLPEGNYELMYLTHLEKHFLFVYWSYEYTYLYFFTVDRTAPTISGATSSVSYKNTAFTVTASDSLSGIKNFWYAEPGDTYYKKASGTSVTIPAGSKTGYYYFYATDNAGNESATHYVYYDNTKPAGNLYTTSNSVLSGTYTNDAFYYQASDSGGATISYLNVTKPSGKTTQTINANTGKYSIAKTSGDGYYAFSAVDKAGNVSATKSIYLDTTAPVGTLYCDGSTVESGSSKIGAKVKYVASDTLSGINSCYVKKPGASSYVAYTSGTELTAFGTYYFYCKDNAGNTSPTRSFTLKEYIPPAATYTVSYNANGGSGAPASQTKTEKIGLTLSTVIPVRTGYEFLGWSRNSTATSPTFVAGGTYSDDANISLYAVWKRRTYDVVYIANGGSGAPSAQTKTYGINLTLSSTQPTRNGFTFLGWGLSSTATTESYSPGGTFTGNYPMTLYAVWQKNPETYTIKYDANGGTGAPASQTKTENVDLTLSSTVPTKAYHTFLGWAKTSTSTSVSYVAGDTYKENSAATLYAVWLYSPDSYTVRYNANGGTGAPASQTKTEGISLTLSSGTPTRERYTFLGWSTSSTATTATYQPGGNYTVDRSATLYAVWSKDDYEFSISSLTISESEIYRYGNATIRVRVDSWDRDHVYSNIPVTLYYDGKLVGSQNVNLAKYGIAYATFTLNVGDAPGEHTVEARVNWDKHGYETNPNNNTVQGKINVKDYDYELSVGKVEMTGGYTAGSTVITSFLISNDSDTDITPDNHCNAVFTAYYYSGTQKIVLAMKEWSDFVAPGGKSNLVYFKWDVPANLEGKTVYCECSVNTNNDVDEANRANNTAIGETVIGSRQTSATPNTRYEKKAPSTYNAAAGTLTTNSESASWNMWVYEDGDFALKTYGVEVTATPVVTPDTHCRTAVKDGSTWKMKSGYGITLSWEADLSAPSGYLMPDDEAYTTAQNVYARFPEYNYLTASGMYATLDTEDGEYCFTPSEDAEGNARLHFIPVYVVNGNYVVSCTASEIWTPAGMIKATKNSNILHIDGTIFDDWYH